MVAWKLHSSYNLSSQEQVLALKSGQYFEKIERFLLSKPVHMSIQGLIFRFMDYLKPFAPSLLLAILLLISIATEGWTGKIKESEQPVLLFINHLSTTTRTLVQKNRNIGELVFKLLISIFNVCPILNYIHN